MFTPLVRLQFMISGWKKFDWDAVTQHSAIAAASQSVKSQLQKPVQALHSLEIQVVAANPARLIKFLHTSSVVAVYTYMDIYTSWEELLHLILIHNYSVNSKRTIRKALEWENSAFFLKTHIFSNWVKTLHEWTSMKYTYFPH